MSAPRVALLSDIHGNSPALQAVLDEIQREGCTRVFMLGDIINGFDPHGCVQLLRTWSNAANVELAAIKGNAEAYLTTPERSALPHQDKAWNADMICLVQWFQDQLSASDLEWVHSLPDTLRWNDALLVHDSPMDRLAIQAQSDPAIQPHHREWFFHGRGLLPDMDGERWQELIEYMQEENLKQVFCGHTHVPFHRQVDSRSICNVGSVGAPLDGDPRAAWVLLEGSPDEEQTLSIRRVEYDIPATLRLIDATPDYPDLKIPGYHEAYKKWIQTGIHWRAHLRKAQ